MMRHVTGTRLSPVHARAGARFGLLALLAWLVFPPFAHAETPRLLNYQGRLFSGAAAFDGVGQFKFALVNADGSRVFWSNSVDTNGDGEPDAAVTLSVSRGGFSVFLGDSSLPNMALLPAEVFAADALYLRVWFRDGAKPFVALAPDQRLGSVAYAMVAATVPDGSVTAVKLAPGAVSAPQVSGVFTVSQVPNLDASKIVSGQLDPARLPQSLLNQTSQLAGSVASLQQQVTTLSHELDVLYAKVEGIPISNPTLPSGLTLVSEFENDPTMASLGYLRFMNVPAAPWQTGPSEGAPSARRGHSGAWTGHEWIIWGGELGGGNYLSSGAFYVPADGAWTPVSPVDAPTARSGHTAVWTGSEMILWGGYGGQFRGDGSRFSLKAQHWSPINSLSAPAGRDGHVAIWTGTRMVVWGGRNTGGLLGDGAVYDPATDTWSALPGAGAPAARRGAVAVWTGSALVIWGGETASGPANTGAVLPFTSGVPGAWKPMNVATAPAGRSGHAGVWTGRHLLIWGGANGSGVLGSGAQYDPQRDTWAALPATTLPARTGHQAVWTGVEMLVTGGDGVSGPVASAAAYDSDRALWRPLSSDGAPLARANAVAAWTGSELLVFGGQANGLPVASLQRLNPQKPFYFYRKI